MRAGSAAWQRPAMAAVVMTLAMTACGGSGSGGGIATELGSSTVMSAAIEGLVPFTVDEADPASRAAMTSLVEAHGDAGGFVALVSALERGYNADQVLAGAAAGGIDEGGSIVIDGVVVAPVGSRAGILELAEDGDGPTSLNPGAVRGVLASHLPSGFEEDLQAIGLLPILEEADEEHEVVPAAEVQRAGPGVAYGLAILELARTGYPLEAIVVALLEGRRAQRFGGPDRDPAARSCAVLEDPETGFLVPRPIPDTPCWREVCAVLGPSFCPADPGVVEEPTGEASDDPVGEPPGDEGGSSGGQSPSAESVPADPAPDDTVVVVEGELTGGPIIDGAGPIVEAVTENELEFVLSFADGVVTGEGIVNRRIDGSNDDCRDRYMSPLGFTFEGTFSTEDGTASGTFEWEVVEAKVEQLELEQLGATECTGRTSFAAGSGEWEATWRGDAGTFEGSLTIPGGLGTNTFELDVTTVITTE